MKTLILCAGEAKRLGDLARWTPKSLLPIGNEPLLGHTLRWLSSQGFTDILINVHRLVPCFLDLIGDGRHYGAHVIYSYEEKLCGTAGSAARLLDWLGQDFLVVYGDVITDQELEPLTKKHSNANALATIFVEFSSVIDSYLELDADDRVTEFIERPSLKQRKEYKNGWRNTGIQILNKSALAMIGRNQFMELPSGVYRQLISTGRIYGVPITGYRSTIDTPELYAEAQKVFQEGKLRWTIG